MGNYYLAVDIGASSGRHILGSLRDGKIVLEEVYRFANGMEERDGHLVWDTGRLFSEIISGMKKCAEIGKIPAYMGIDTWAVDYALLDKNDALVARTYGYRDGRTAGMDEKVYEIISERELYARTGIQKAIFNTIYQLMAAKQQEPETLAQAETLLLLPDYFNFLLTGIKQTEYTNATTGQLVDPVTKDWDFDLIRKLGFPEKIFCPIALPGTRVGALRPEIAAEVGYDLTVLLPATHDTASAVAAVPTEEEHALYISSGTWSLLGTELLEANCSEKSRRANLTNEGGVDYRFRYLKNIMGLWMIQSVKAEFDREWSYAELCAEAAKQEISSIVDCDDPRFFAPKSMSAAVREACAESGQTVPETDAEIAAVIYNSLAEGYRKAIEEISEITGLSFDRLHIVGGGSNADYLNEVTAACTGLEVLAGPGEATAIGNLALQMIHTGDLKDLASARKTIAASFELKRFLSAELKETGQ